MFRNLISYSLIITQLSTLKISNLIKNVIKTFESLKMHILIIVFYVFLTVRKSLIFKYKFFLTHVLKAVQQLLLFSIHLTRSIKMTFIKIIPNLIYFQK